MQSGSCLFSRLPAKGQASAGGNATSRPTPSGNTAVRHLPTTSQSDQP